jgi:hypothetical protein
MAETSTYMIWAAMHQRCYNSNNAKFELYGGRGITVHKRWHDLKAFYADMGDPPEGMTLDRYPNRDGDYELTNCRWATPQQQVINTDRIQDAVGVKQVGARFYPRIKRNYVEVSLGGYGTFEEAAAVRRAVKEQLDAAGAVIAVTLLALPAVAGPLPDRTNTPSAASTMTAAQLCASSFTTQSIRDVDRLVVVSNRGRRSRALQMRVVSVLGGWSRRTLAIIFPNSIWPTRAHAG